MAKDADHLKLRAGVKQTLEQAHSALDAYFEFLKRSVSSFTGALASSSPSSRARRSLEVGRRDPGAAQILQKRRFAEGYRCQTEAKHLLNL